MFAAVAVALIAAAPAQAQTAGSLPGSATLTQPTPGAKPPPGRRRTVSQVEASALRVEKVARLRRENLGSYVRAYLRDEDRWQVSLYRAGDRKELAQVMIDDRTGAVVEAWTGVQVEWTMARGYPGAFGRRAAALYVWLPLLALFLLPFARPPWRLLHLDLAVIAALSVSFAFFSNADIRASVLLAYPPLVYLLVRLLALARHRDEREPLRLVLSEDAMAIAIVFLLGFRLGLQIKASNVIDVGYAGVIGADRITHGHALYGGFPADNPHGDTYGPANYLAYVPFELVWPWTHEWDDLPAAHAATAVFDLACAAGLWLLGRRLRGPRLGLLLAYLWLTCPFTLLAANSGANDPLVGALVLGALALGARPAGRGAAVGLAAMAKFAPLALAPLFAGRRATVVMVATVAVLLGFVAVLDGGLGAFYDQAIRFQADRASPFSVWGWYDLPGPQRAVQLAAALLAIAVAFVPRRRDTITVAALGAAVLIAVQLGMTHWFYLYVVWFLPLALVALIAPAVGPARSSPPAPATSSG